MSSWLRGCITKAAYDELSTAEYHARKVSKKYNREMIAYKCEHCLNFHLATKNPLLKQEGISKQ